MIVNVIYAITNQHVPRCLGVDGVSDSISGPCLWIIRFHFFLRTYISQCSHHVWKTGKTGENVCLVKPGICFLRRSEFLPIFHIFSFHKRSQPENKNCFNVIQCHYLSSCMSTSSDYSTLPHNLAIWPGKSDLGSGKFHEKVRKHFSTFWREPCYFKLFAYSPINSLLDDLTTTTLIPLDPIALMFCNAPIYFSVYQVCFLDFPKPLSF